MAETRDDTLGMRREGHHHHDPVTPLDRVHGEALYLGVSRAAWPAIWAGFFLGSITYLVLNLLGVALGATWLSADQVSRGTINTAAGIWLIVTTLISFFVGGFVTGRMSAIPGQATGAMNGLLYGAFALILTTVFTLLPVMAGVPFVTWLFGALGTGMNFAGPGASPNASPEQAVNISQSAAWWAFFGLVSALVAATVGGWTGARHALLDPLATTGEARREDEATVRRRAAA